MLLVTVIWLPVGVSAQEPPAAPQPAAGVVDSLPEARQEDVATVEATVRALYDVISGPAGERDWDRMRSLFAPGARLIPAVSAPSGGALSRLLTVDDYIARSGPYFRENGFYEREVSRVAEEFGNVAHVFSTYESRHAPDDAEPFVTGINAIQLVKDRGRWWVTGIAWDEPRQGSRIPERYLHR